MPTKGLVATKFQASIAIVGLHTKEYFDRTMYVCVRAYVCACVHMYP